MNGVSTLTPEFILGFALAILAGIVWLVRLEAMTRNNRDVAIENRKLIEKSEQRVDRLEIKHDQTFTEMRTVLLSIQKSISNIEGRLSINSRGD